MIFRNDRQYAVELFFSFIIFMWYLATWKSGNTDILSPALFPFDLASRREEELSSIISVLFWLPGIIALWKLIAPLLRRVFIFADASSVSSSFLSAANSFLVVILFCVHILMYANQPGYFTLQPLISWITFIAAAVYNIISVIRLIQKLSRKSSVYLEYEQFRYIHESRSKSKNPIHRERGIQFRLLSVFTVFILMLIVTLSVIQLRDFRKTLIASAISRGEGLAEGFAGVVKYTINDPVSLKDYFEVEDDKNEHEDLNFESLSFYLESDTPDIFVVRYSTNVNMLNKQSNAGMEIPEATNHVIDEKAGILEVITPVYGDNELIGYLSIIYKLEVILEPYFRMKIKVLIIACLFIYISILVTYLIGRSIVFPLLYLRMSVHFVSSKLSSMIKGDEKISSDSLIYDDYVSTRDEIKKLSKEFGEMTGIIRGILPYISGSTLRHADRKTLLSERREMTFLFTDIRGFTSLCEGREPEDIVAMLNRYLEIQTGAIHAAGGEIDKFVGDEIMADFSGHGMELKSCMAALEIMKAMEKEREELKQHGSEGISIGIGINTGYAVFGSVGARERMDFTSIGDAVNLAARLEGANKIYGTGILVSEAVKDKVQDAILMREIDLITVKGKTMPVRIYELFNIIENATDSQKRLKILFEEGLGFYRKRNWDSAEESFSILVNEYSDKPADVFLKRIELFRNDPPDADWNGVFEMTVK